MEIRKIKRIFFSVLIIPVVYFLLIYFNNMFSYSKRIGNTNFYIVRTSTWIKSGEPAKELCYSPNGNWYAGENIPRFPKIILWNDRYLISKNFDGYNPEITEYVIFNLDSIKGSVKPTDCLRFKDESTYYNYLKQIGISEADMNQTDNRILWQ